MEDAILKVVKEVSGMKKVKEWRGGCSLWNAEIEAPIAERERHFMSFERGK